MNKSFTLIEMQIVIAIIGILECFASGHSLKSSNISLQKRALLQSFVTKLKNRKQCALKPYLMNVQISNPLLLEIPTLTLLEVQLRPRKNSRPICSICGVRSSCYDHLPERQFQFIPFWGFQVFIQYSIRRVNCQTCGIKVEQVSWADGKHTLTHEYAKYLSD
ncbi:MAG: transposase family protein [Lentisphaerales bacterium]|nr:transposase family protein [Lentisphaerales bacterium]